MTPRRFRVDPRRVVHETIDGETILIHLGTGTYYSLDGVGAEAWELLAAGATRETLLAFARRRYLGDPVEIELGLLGLVDRLLEEGLLVERDELPGSKSNGRPGGQVEFAVPVLQAYTDMQEFMLVDPLHEVDEVAGWPHAPAG
jgi:Coenzyme PQQ synthesis protein D (PqqD)